MSEQPPFPPQDPNLPPSGPTPPPPGGYGAPPPAPGGYGAPPGRPPYDVIEAVKYGWRKFTANWLAFVLLALLALVVPGVVSGIGSGFSSGGSALLDSGAPGGQLAVGGGLSLVGVLFNIVAQVISLVFMAALVRAGLDATEGRVVDIGAAFTRWSFLHVLLLALIVGVGTVIGLVLCIIPGLVFLFFTWFGTYFVVARGESAPQAVASSMRFTASNIGSLLLLALVSVVLGIAGLLACVVGLLVAVPVTTVAAAYTFKVLNGEPVAP